MKVLVYDIETMKEFFLIGVYNPETDVYHEFELNKWKNDLDSFIRFTESHSEHYWVGYNKAKESYEVISPIRELHQYKLGLEDGYKKAKETLYTKQDLIDLVQQLKDYTKESHTILGHDDREAIEFVDIFLDYSNYQDND